ncbi:MAG: autotransporter-associated beta strand repeat-containing protein [Kiritimatiellia bacterium]
MLSQAGARPWARDARDAAVAADVAAGTGGFVDSTAQAGGYPVLAPGTAPADTDNDGMPDDWETCAGMNAGVADNNGDLDGDGYTNLEEYLDWAAAPHAFTPVGVAVDLDLNTLNGGRSGLACTVGGAAGGTIALLADGHTARFTPTAGFIGLAGFTFSFTATGSTVAQTVGVAVSGHLPKALIWVGSPATWDIASTAGFRDGASASVFQPGDQVTFDQTGAGGVTLAGVLAPSSMVVDAAKDYDFGGAGSLGGAMSLTKSGVGKLTLNTANSFTGGTTVTGGTLTLGNATAAGTGMISLKDATLDIGALNVPNTLNLTGGCTLTGGSSCRIRALTGDGTANLNVTSGVFDLSGGMSAFTGTLAITTPSVVRFLGCAGGPDVTYDLGNTTASMSLRSLTPQVEMGALTGGSGTTLRGHTNNDAPNTFVIGAKGLDTTFAGVIANGTGAAARVSLVKTGVGSLTLTGANTCTGGTTVNEGTLNLLGNQGGATGGLAMNILNSTATAVNIGSAAQTAATTANFGAAAIVQLGSTARPWREI